MSNSDAADSRRGLEERTDVFYGIENIINKTREVLSRVKEKVDVCAGNTGPSVFLTVKPVWTAYSALKDRGIRLRFITEITENNISYCKELMKTAELRHLDGIKGNFGIVDEIEYYASAVSPHATPLSQQVFSNVKEFVEQQQYFFDMLWSKAIPAKQRFKEIEQGAKREFVETIRDPYEIQQLGFDLIKKAEEEILLLFSTSNAFRRQEKAGAIELLKEAATMHGVKVRVLVPIDTNNDGLNETIQQLENLGIDIRTVKNIFQNKLTVLLVDQSLCLTVELKDDTRESSEEAIGLATYSNSEATVFSYVSIFENLWIQTELHNRQQQEEAGAS